MPVYRRRRHSRRWAGRSLYASFAPGHGGASLFVPGISLDDIRRFGRSESEAIREYFRTGDPQCRHLNEILANSVGLTDQLRLAIGKTEWGGGDLATIFTRSREIRHAAPNEDMGQ